MLTLEPFSEDQGRSAVHPARGIPPISFLAPCGFTHPLTRTHVRLLGPCFKTGRMGCPQAGAGSTQVYRRDGACCQPRSTRRHLHEPIDSSGFGRRTNPHRSTPRVDRRTGYRRSTSDRDASPAPIRFPPDNFKHSLTLFSKGLGPGPPLRTLLQTTIRTARPSDFQAGLIPVRSPLLRESLASLTAHDARHNTRVFSTTTSRASTEGDSSLGQPHHKHGRPISAPMPCVPIRDAWLGATRCVTPRQACPRPDGFGRNLRSKTRWFTGFCNSHPSIAFCYVLHRCVSRDIRCRESFVILREATTNTHTANGTKLDASFSFVVFLGTYRAGVCYGVGLKSMAPPNGATTNISRRGASDRAKARYPLTPGYRYMFTGRSALQGSTMILPQVHLRKPCYDFLLPLNDKVQWNSRDVAGGEPPTSPRS
ncbi:hypothetical protein L1887_60185 [Cichorium endivia]|nr:hypothetical protein L1887_60185 [Cichorium endivia]